MSIIDKRRAGNTLDFLFFIFIFLWLMSVDYGIDGIDGIVEKFRIPGLTLSKGIL